MAAAPTTHPSLLIRLRDPRDEQAWCEFTEIYGRSYTNSQVPGAPGRRCPGPRPRRFPGRGSGSIVTIPIRPEARSGPGSRESPQPDHQLARRRARHPRGTGKTDMEHLFEQQPDTSGEESALFETEYRRRLLIWAAERVRPSFSGAPGRRSGRPVSKGSRRRRSRGCWECRWVLSINTRAGSSTGSVARSKKSMIRQTLFESRGAAANGRANVPV